MRQVRAGIDYDSQASAYARGREAAEHLLRELVRGAGPGGGERVLEVGCGAATHVSGLVGATGCSGLGVDPSAGMLAQARRRAGVALVQGRAERLPVRDAVCSLVFSVNVVHHLSDIRAFFAEARRVLVPGGWLCTATDSEDMIRRRAPLSVYWPESAAADLARYPGTGRLLDDMARAGFCEVATREVSAAFTVGDAAPYRARVYSCLRLISRSAFDAGLRRLEADLENGPVAGLSEFACVWGRAP